MDAEKLPTDSLYKMLTVGGLVLVVAGIALGWKAIDETQESSIAIVEAEAELASAATPLLLQYSAICDEHRSIEDEMVKTIRGVNVEAAKEFKGGQPNDFPALVDTLSISESSGTEWGVRSVPKMDPFSGVDTWLKTVNRMRDHYEVVSSYLTAPNLTVIGKDLREKGLKRFGELQSKISELERSALTLAAPEQKRNSSLLRNQVAKVRQRIVLGFSLALFLLGGFTFGRASKNWYEQLQRYQDAKVRGEAKEQVVDSGIDVKKELRWIGLPVGVAVAIIMVLWLLRLL